MNEKRRAELRLEIQEAESDAKALCRNQERFFSDKYFVQKLAHETGYAHEEEMIFQFNDRSGDDCEGEKNFAQRMNKIYE